MSQPNEEMNRHVNAMLRLLRDETPATKALFMRQLEGYIKAFVMRVSGLLVEPMK